METTRLEMFFNDVAEQKVKVSIDDPRIDLIASDIETAMLSVISSDVFVTSNGALVSIAGAQIVTVNVNELEF